MKIAVDIRGSQQGFKDHLRRGIGRFVIALAPRLPSLMADADFYYLLDARLPSPGFEIPDGVKCVSCGRSLPLVGKGEILRTQFSIRSKLLSIRPDLTLFFCHEDGLLFWPRSAVFVYDLIPYNFPDLYGINKGFKGRLRMALTKQIAISADHIFTISESSRTDIEHFWGIPPDKISIVYAAIDTDKFTRRSPLQIEEAKVKYKLPQKYILYVGGIDARKNVSTLLCAYAKLAGQIDDIRLVMAGKIDNQKEYPLLLEKIASLKLSDKIHLPGFIDDADLPAVYSGAEATSFPSLYEGFGLPALESLSCGTPLIASKRSAIPEAVGDMAIYCDVADSDDLAVAMQHALCDDLLRERFRTLGPLQAKKFSWHKVASNVAEVLIGYLEKSGRS